MSNPFPVEVILSLEYSMKKLVISSATVLSLLFTACGTTSEITREQDAKVNEGQGTDELTLQNGSQSWGGVNFIVYIEQTANVGIKTQLKNAMTTIGKPFNRTNKQTYWPLIIAMAEEKTLNVSAWPAGFGDGKSGDAANFGIYKMNWYMLRQVLPTTYGSAFNNLGPNSYNNKWPNNPNTIAQIINSNVGIATRLLYAAMAKWSTAQPVENVKNNFWAGHRCGGTGLDFGRTCVGNESYENQVVRYYKGIQALTEFAAARYSESTLWTTPLRLGADLFPI
jgi:hypothetical protein